jgi:hypothetical protein
MNGDWSKPPVWLICAMWLALPISAMEYRQNWDALPARMAVHFDANWNPNGFTSREGALELGLGIMVVMLVLFTVGAFSIRALKRRAAWPMLAVFYVVLGFVWYGNHSIIEFNLKSPRPPLALALKTFPNVQPLMGSNSNEEQ